MKTAKNRIRPALWICLAGVLALACSLRAQSGAAAGADKAYFAIEINGVVCGYLEISETPLRREGRDIVEQEADMFLMLSALGSQFNSKIKVNSLLDAATRRSLQADIRIDQGQARFDFSLRTTATEAILHSTLRGETKRVAITPGLLIGGDEVFRRVKREFLANHADELRCDVLEMVEEEVQRSMFRKIGEERITLAGRDYPCLVIEQANEKTGVKTTYWLDPESDFFVQFAVSGRKVYLSDRRVVDRIKVANMDASFFTKSNVSIADVTAITYMKLKVKIEPTGAVLTAADLNVPGQKFTGTVKDNLIDGVLEIEHARYDGKDAPPFPPKFHGDGRLKEYLEPDRFIESTDPVLVAKAREITAGAADCWQAATRLSRWVAENIGYAIPGGVTARKTYDLRAGDCGSHSMLLAAFCRAVGIPARVVFGALYVPNFGGGFGQHGWNEVHVGPAGWIPVDSTAFEVDFVDSGHIRIMEVRSAASSKFNGREIEVLEHRLAGQAGMAGAAETAFAPYLGKFSHLRKGRSFTVMAREGNLALDVPGRTVLPFNREDERGRWRCKLTPRVYLTFKGGGDGRAREMAVHEVAFLPRSGEAPPASDVPAELAPYPGTYRFAAVNADMTVLVQEGRLAVYDPTDKTTARFRPTAIAGEWIDDFGFVTISFERDAQGQVSGMKIDTADTFVRGELAADLVGKEVADGGVEAGLKKFAELKESGDKEVLFSEESLNLLAYRILNSGKLGDAIALFQLIVREYPRSSNAYGCLAEAYVKNNQLDLALGSYQMSLRLNPGNERARQRIEELKRR